MNWLCIGPVVYLVPHITVVFPEILVLVHDEVTWAPELQILIHCGGVLRPGWQVGSIRIPAKQIKARMFCSCGGATIHTCADKAMCIEAGKIELQLPIRAL